MAHSWTAKQLQTSFLWLPQVLSIWLGKKYINCSSNSHAYPGYSKRMVFKFWAARNVTVGLKSDDLSNQDVNCNSVLCSWNQTRSQFDSCYLENCLAGGVHFYFRRHIPCSGANDLQLCSDNSWWLWLFYTTHRSQGANGNISQRLILPQHACCTRGKNSSYIFIHIYFFNFFQLLFVLVCFNYFSATSIQKLLLNFKSSNQISLSH